MFLLKLTLQSAKSLQGSFVIHTKHFPQWQLESYELIAKRVILKIKIK